ncbi:Glucuronoxylan 4-O-methyltransferase 1 [Striga hermonthica]|uniref:Glucuronoxylan 4-O-methyltransferase 1 n=1 Tax=Striga hermonthica TaxID=68872 RepID=A0A9N7MVJ5_STRHE|nr:Glucuronoxylan 4-O-methyltransferase 1 [Striga hermonthica]
MRPKTQLPFNLKLLFILVILSLFLLFILRSNLSTSSDQIDSTPTTQSTMFFPRKSSTNPNAPSTTHPSACNKIPTSLAQAIIHYSTSTITPQQTLGEISVTSRILERKSPCNFLVFGLGHDSLMWHSLNHGGRTVFLEEDESWVEQVRRRFPMLESRHVAYETRVSEADRLIEAGRGPECVAVSDPRYSMCQLALKGLPGEVYETEWDVIMVDAPTGYYEEAPGRMGAIYTAGMMARNYPSRRGGSGTHVLVHDVNREVEDRFSREFLCEGYMKRQEGRLRHFVVPSHRDDLGKPFCP